MPEGSKFLDDRGHLRQALIGGQQRDHGTAIGEISQHGQRGAGRGHADHLVVDVVAASQIRGQTPGRVQIARFWCGRLARLLRDSSWAT
jgi:hypothetical protein